ncbi:hypothetical protein VB773_13245 [Haloarculaceae archaeon H-GB2-1]|nr:hypothetical protein [Haloarculaceae archaeon H-GB2-1]
MQKLRVKNGSGMATIPKTFLEQDGVVDPDGEFPNEQALTVDRLDERVYVVRMTDEEGASRL